MQVYPHLEVLLKRNFSRSVGNNEYEKQVLDEFKSAGQSLCCLTLPASML